MRLRGRKNKDAKTKLITNNNKSVRKPLINSTASSGSDDLEDNVVFPKTRKQLRIASKHSNKESRDSRSEENTNLTPEDVSEGARNLRHRRKKPFSRSGSKRTGLNSDLQTALKQGEVKASESGQSYTEIPKVTSSQGGHRTKTDKPQVSSKNRKRGKNVKSVESDSNALFDLMSSPEKQARLELDISPCSVSIEKIDSSGSLAREDANVDTDKSPTKYRSRNHKSYLRGEELLSLLDEGTTNTNSSDSSEDLQQSSTKRAQRSTRPLNSSKIVSTGETTLRSSNFYSKMSFSKKTASTPQAPSSLNAWLKTAKTHGRSSTEDTSGNDDAPKRTTKLAKHLLHKITTNSKMQHDNMHTPLEVRRIARLESTPQLSSESEPRVEEDLFGFEKLLRPDPNFFDHVSPIPRPKIPQERKSKKKDLVLPPKSPPEPLDGLSDITNSRLTPKKRLRRKAKGQKHHKTKTPAHDVEDEVESPDLSEVDLFNVTPIEREKREPLNEYAFNDDLPQVKIKRNKQQIPKFVEFDLEDALPWKEIDEHELVVETV